MSGVLDNPPQACQILMAGNYKVTISDLNSCQDTASILIQET